MVLLFAFFILNRLQVTRRQKKVIEEQKQKVEEQKQVVEEQKKDINVLIGSDGRIEIKGFEIQPVDLADRLFKAMEEANNKNIIIQADGECPQRHVVLVVDKAKEVGVEGIAFARETLGMDE